MQSGVIIFLSLIAGLAFGIVIMFLVSKAGLNKDQQKAEKILRIFLNINGWSQLGWNR